jgi:hypothetical protein
VDSLGDQRGGAGLEYRLQRFLVHVQGQEDQLGFRQELGEFSHALHRLPRFVRIVHDDYVGP